ncbi:MAG: DNA polymerase [Sedimenticola sp.]
MTNLKDLLAIPYVEPKNKTIKRVLATIDSETDPFKIGRYPKPFIWGFYDGSVYEEFNNVRALLDFFEKQFTEKDIQYRVYAHNGGKFDYHFMLEHLEADTDVMIINGRLSKFNIGPTEFRDSYNLFNFPLAAYKKDDMDYGLMEEEERDKPKNKRIISDYLEKDCVYLHEMVHGFIETYGLHLTQASASMKIWQKMCSVKAPKTTENYYDALKPFYYGGRVECFKKGIIEEVFSVIDIVSAYPHAMGFEHPIGVEYKTLHGKKACDYVEDKGGITNKFMNRCFFTLLAKSSGSLPYRDDKGKLFFPNDHLIRRYTVTGWEIAAGLRTETLRIHQILSVTYWNEYIDFTQYVDHFFKLKKEGRDKGDKLMTLFAKLFLNSLYGKFAADPRNYKSHKVVDTSDIHSILEEGYEAGGFLGEWFLAKKAMPHDRQRFYNIATAASITGFVRAYLWEAACKCSGLLYSDTDSIAAKDISQIKLGCDLGDWEKEGEFSYGAIGGKKMYAFQHTGKNKWKTASKGARLTSKEIILVAKGNEVLYDPMAPTYSIKHEPRFTQRKIVRT